MLMLWWTRIVIFSNARISEQYAEFTCLEGMTFSITANSIFVNYIVTAKRTARKYRPCTLSL